jgi:hypothetical protein
LKRGGRRCARCRFDWRPGRWPLRLNAREWRRLLEWFVRGAPSATIAREAHLDRKRVLRALAIVRQRLTEEAPPIVLHGGDAEAHGEGQPEAHVEVPVEAHPPETDVAPDAATAWQPAAKPSRRSAVLGLYAEQGLVWADVIPPPEADALRARLRHHPRHALTWNGGSRYAAVAYRGRLHRVIPPSGASRATPSFGLLESFWAYAQRQLRGKGGIRLSRLDLYLAEWAWRYNHRRQTPDEQLRELLTLTRRAGRRSGTIPGPIARKQPAAARDHEHHWPS